MGSAHQNVDFFGPLASIYVLPDAATLSSQVFTPVGSSTPVSSLVQGQSYTAALTYQNTGSTSWIGTGADQFDLYNLQGDGPMMGYPVSSTIAPGQSNTFTFSFTAIPNPGTMQWGLVHQNNDFFGPLASIPVVAADQATLSSQVFTPVGSSTPVTTLAVGQTYNASEYLPQHRLKHLEQRRSRSFDSYRHWLGRAQPGLAPRNTPQSTAIFSFTFHLHRPLKPGHPAVGTGPPERRLLRPHRVDHSDVKIEIARQRAINNPSNQRQRILGRFGFRGPGVRRLVRRRSLLRNGPDRCLGLFAQRDDDFLLLFVAESLQWSCRSRPN